MYTLRQYLLTLSDSCGLTRTLGEIDVCRDEFGNPCFSAGNSAVVFRIRHQGRICSLRCYLHPMRHLTEIYGDRLLPKELYLYTSPDSGVWADAVLGDWVEGMTLQQAIVQAVEARDRARLSKLSEAFDMLSADLVSDQWAHGDLKPENIIVDAHGALHLIDFDALFLPAFDGETSPELGTAAFQHPSRSASDFDAALDDYPTALIATALHALILDPTLYHRYGDADGLLFTPQHIHTDPALHEVLALFERMGAAAEYRIARLLLAPSLRLPQLAPLLRKQTDGNPCDTADTTLELFVDNGLWGYRTDERIVIPPLYDCGFDFTEALAAVRLGQTWHYIDPAGETVLSLPGCEAVKPFRNGRAQIVRNGHRAEINRSGREFAV